MTPKPETPTHADAGAATKHTPGPWEVSPQGNTNESGVFGGVRTSEEDGWVIADVWADVEELEQSAEANARLIAASPELLDALKNLLSHYQKLYNEGEKTPAIRKAEAAIAKAEGGQ